MDDSPEQRLVQLLLNRIAQMERMERDRPARLPVPSKQVRGDNSPDQLLLRTFLNRLAQWLSVLPKTDRAEVLQEVRQHIVALAAAQEWSQGEPTEAMRRALHEFGDVDTLGPSLLETWLKRKAEQTRTRQTPAIKRRRLFVETLKAAGWGFFLVSSAATDVAISQIIWLIVWAGFIVAVGNLEKRLLPDDFTSPLFGFDVVFKEPFAKLTFRRRMQLQSELDASRKGKAVLPRVWFYGALALQCALIGWVWPRIAHGKSWAEDDALKFIFLFVPLFFAEVAGFIYKPRHRV